MTPESSLLQIPPDVLPTERFVHVASPPFPIVALPVTKPLQAPTVEPDPVAGPLARLIAGIRRRADRVLDAIGGVEEVPWSRVVMRREIDALIRRLGPARLDALEISGDDARRFSFRSYRTVSYPDYDVCAAPLAARFDLILAEQVFEHLRWPYRAGRNVHAMLSPGGFALISTPFLVRLHEHPIDCTRWSETGLRHFLAECGFPFEKIQTGSWGNRACVKANFDRWARYRRRFHSLVNEPRFPYHVWALAQK